jgi:hypothetical protein
MYNPNNFAQKEKEPTGINADSPLLGEYITLFLQNAKFADEQSDGRVLLYRGQSDKAYSLTPSVFREGLLEKEHVIIYELLLNSPYEFSNIENKLERLIKMQHYGLPTRLLDVTTNPLVAMFFACNENPCKDGEIIVFYDYIQRSNAIYAKCIAELAEYTGSSERQMLGFLTGRGFPNLELGRLTQMTHIPIEPPLNNERIRRQRGAFLVVGVRGNDDGNPLQKVVFDLKPYLIKDLNDGIPRSIIIPKNEKIKLLKELETFGINQAFLFPELEHQTTYIKNKYKEV